MSLDTFEIDETKITRLQQNEEILNDIAKNGAGSGLTEEQIESLNNIERKADITFSKNLYDRTKIILGKFISSTGVLSNNAIYNVTDKINIKPSTIYILSIRARFIIFWDKDGNVITQGSITADTAAKTAFSTPANAASVRITTYASDLHDRAQLEEGSISTGFVAYGKYLNEKIGSKNVGLDALDFIEKGKNLFNKHSSTLGFFISTTGSRGASDTYGISDFIPVVSGDKYYSSGYLRYVTYYSSDYAVMASVSIGVDASNVPNKSAFVVPNNAAYMIITFRVSEIDILQIEVGERDTGYSTYSYVYKDIPIKEKEDSIGISSIAPKQYVCHGKHTTFYTENMISDFKKYSGQIELSLNITPSRWKFDSVNLDFLDTTGLVNTSSNLTIETSDKYFNTVDKTVSSVKVVDMTKNSAITVLNIGDSYTGRMTWANKINNEINIKENITYLGVRDSNAASPIIPCEGRGGWTMNNYFSPDTVAGYNPFQQPVNQNYFYYGSTDFWIGVNGGSSSYSQLSYTRNGAGFDNVTGLKKAPAVNDIMRMSNNSYVVWTGSSWDAIDVSVFGGLEFNFSRYRLAWGIPIVNIVCVLLGTNDFSSASINGFKDKYNTFKSQYDTLIASIHNDNSSTKIVIGIPVSSGKQGKYGSLITERKKLGYWMLSKALIADYAGREGENIYLLDYHSQVDRVFGYGNVQEVPFIDYDGANLDDQNLYKEDTVHLSEDGFDQMGLAYMAMLQELR